MKTSQYRQKSKTKLSPLAIGFITSCVLHLSVFAMFIKHEREMMSVQTNNTISINLSNIVSPNVGNALEEPKKRKVEKKKKPKHKKQETFNKDELKVADEVVQSEEVELVDDASDDSSDESNASNSEMASSAGGGGSQGYLNEDSALYLLIKNAIDRHNEYPKIALRRKIEGDVVVEFVIFKNGDVSDIKVIKGSHNILSKGAVDAVKRASAEFPHMSNNTRVKIVIVYNLYKT